MIGGYNNRQMPVAINIYDISPSNDSLFPLGLGFYHSGVVVDGQEYTFSQSGVFSHRPRDLNGSEAKYRETVVIGSFKGSVSDINRVIDDIKREFRGPDYHIMNKNCNHFANTFARKLIGQPIPAYINRMADCGNFFGCIINPLINLITASQNQNQNQSQSNASINAGQHRVQTTLPFSGGGRRLGS
jgi:deubiquitinase DESI2